MINFKVETLGVEGATLMLDALSKAVEDLTKPLEQAATYMKRSILTNFLSGGRPKWAPYSPNTHDRGDMLVRTGAMMNSITSLVVSNQLVLSAEDKKAPLHQHGWPETNLPARPFLMFQPDDIVKIADLIQKYLQNVTQARISGKFASGQTVSSSTRKWTNLGRGRTRVVGSFKWVPNK